MEAEKVVKKVEIWGIVKKTKPPSSTPKNTNVLRNERKLLSVHLFELRIDIRHC